MITIGLMRSLGLLTIRSKASGRCSKPWNLWVTSLPGSKRPACRSGCFRVGVVHGIREIMKEYLKSFAVIILKNVDNDIHLRQYSRDEVYTIVRDIYNSTIFSDIVRRNQIRKVDQMERVVKYVLSNMGNTFSAKSISDYLKSEHRSLDNETVYSYLEKLEKAYLIHRCPRQDLRGKGILKTQEKFYVADTALRYSVLGYTPDTVASSLENVVYLELCRRGYTICVGRYKDREIDFVAERQNERLYIQVTQRIESEKTEKREYEQLLEIKDNYPKYVLRTDDFAGGNYKGIKTMHAADFLLSGEY